MQSPLSVWLPFFWGSPALQINIFLKRQCVVNCLDRICTVTLAAMLLQSPDYSVFLGTPQASPSCLQEKKKKREILLGTKIKVLKLLILNVSMSFVFFWTIFGLLPWRLASLGISGCFFFFFFFPLLLLPPFLVVVRPYHFSLLVQKDVNSVAVWAWPGASTLLETC